MKKFKTLTAIVVLFSALLTVSCDTEEVDPVLSGNENENENPTNPTDPGTSEGDYWPLAVNNQWVFSSNGQLMEPFKITGTAIIEGNTYFKASQMFGESETEDLDGTAEMLITKVGGDYRIRVNAEVVEEEGITISVTPYEYIMLKDNIAVGQSWTQTVTQTTTYESTEIPIVLDPISISITFTGTILEKDVTAEVNGTTYNEVIKIKLVQETDGIGGMPVTITNTIWFAKNVGPIKSQASGTLINFNQELESYIVN